MQENNISTPILDMLNGYIEEDNIRFHMPGHKGKMNFPEMKCFNEISKYDLTEVIGTDNLHEPKEAILEAETLLAEAYDADKSFLMVNGSTGGIFVSIAAAFKHGDKVMVASNCHRSVYNAAELFGLDIIIDEISVANLEKLMLRVKDLKGVILTRPDYYGMCISIREISAVCRKYNLMLITDEAHGAHLNFANKGYPVSAVRYSDFTVQSAHKTLGALNQSAYLHLRNRGILYEKEVRRFLSIFQTSSPSYIILASGDCARAYMQEYGGELLERLLVNIKWVTEQIEERTAFKVDKWTDCPKGWVRTPDRLVINTVCGGFIGYAVEKYLRSRSVQVELSDEKRIVCLCSIYDTKEDFERLVDELENMIKYTKELENEDVNSDDDRMLERLYSLRKHIGEVMSHDIVKYPPGVPLIRRGEVLTEEMFDRIEELCLSGANLLGVYR